MHYLIRKSGPDGLVEFEYYGLASARDAARLVFEGDLSNQVHMRRRFNPHTGAELPFEPTDYDQVIEITQGKVTSLPVRSVPAGPLANDFDRAALAAAELYADRVGVSGSPGEKAEQLMRGLVDLSFDTEGVRISELIVELGTDRGDNAKDDSARLLGPLLAELDAALGGDTGVAREALKHYVEESGIEGAEDPSVAFYHLTYGLIEVTEQSGVDFTAMMANVLENPPEPAPVLS